MAELFTRETCTGDNGGDEHTYSFVGYTEDDVRRLYMRLWLRHAHEGDPAPDIKWSAEDDAALRACAGVLDGEK